MVRCRALPPRALEQGQGSVGLLCPLVLLRGQRQRCGVVGCLRPEGGEPVVGGDTRATLVSSASRIDRRPSWRPTVPHGWRWVASIAAIRTSRAATCACASSAAMAAPDSSTSLTGSASEAGAGCSTAPQTAQGDRRRVPPPARRGPRTAGRAGRRERCGRHGRGPGPRRCSTSPDRVSWSATLATRRVCWSPGGGGEVTIDRREVVLGLGGGCQSTRDLVDPPLCGADQATALVGCSRGGALGVRAAWSVRSSPVAPSSDAWSSRAVGSRSRQRSTSSGVSGSVGRPRAVRAVRLARRPVAALLGLCGAAGGQVTGQPGGTACSLDPRPSSPRGREGLRRGPRGPTGPTGPCHAVGRWLGRRRGRASLLLGEGGRVGHRQGRRQLAVGLLAKRGEGFRSGGASVSPKNTAVSDGPSGVSAPGDEGVLDPSQHSFSEPRSGQPGDRVALTPLLGQPGLDIGKGRDVEEPLEHSLAAPRRRRTGRRRSHLREDGNLRELGQAHADEIVNLLGDLVVPGALVLQVAPSNSSSRTRALHRDRRSGTAFAGTRKLGERVGRSRRPLIVNSRTTSGTRSAGAWSLRSPFFVRVPGGSANNA